MVNDSEQSSAADRVSQFTKNRFFDGKLMTARDMQTEQRYHADRLETLARYTTGSGIIEGLAVQSVDAADGTVEITVEPGVAIDGQGRLIVVETPTTKSVPEPDGEELYVCLRFDEVALESVPRADADSRQPETEPNRLLDVFELTYRERPPERERPTADLSESFSTDPAAVGDRLAAAYHDARTDRGADDSDPSVYLAGFERTPEGSWRRLETAPEPSYVYDNELLYSVLVEHLADTENPHQTEVQERSPELPPEELEGIHERVDYLQSELSTLKARQETTTEHLLGKTLASAGRLFASTADRFLDHHPAVSKAAREIAQQATAASHTDATTDPEAFRSVVRRLQPSVVEFGEQLDGAARQQTVDRYFAALADLQSALEADEPAVETAIALDAVAETAVDLEVVYPAHAEQ